MAAEFEVSSLDNSFETKMKNEKANEHVAPIVKRENVVTTKPSLLRRFKEAFLSEDMKDVGDYIIFDIISPGIKNAILDTLERMFFNSVSDRRDRRRDDDYRYGKTSYTSYYRSSSNSRRRQSRDDEYRRDREDKTDYRNIVVKRREDAEEIVRTLRDYINEYDSVSVARLLDLVDEPGKYTDNNWGWTREDDIWVERARGGYYRIGVREAEYLGD